MGALPEGYQPPKSAGRYFKFEEGANKFRILSKVITGYEVWTEDVQGKRKPVRARTLNELKVTGPDQPKHFWAMAVWNRKEKRVQILEVTQRTIQNQLYAFYHDEDWGDFGGYDITVTRKTTPEGRTTYTVFPSPQKPLDNDIKEEIKKTYVKLEALYDGEDPFSENVQVSDEDLEKIDAEIDGEDLPF